jgi:oxygen-independent coproporphyrinogen-3 oxidase
VRFSTVDVLERYVAGAALSRTPVSRQAALEENFFLGLRLARGINLRELSARFSRQELAIARRTISEVVADQLVEEDGDCVRLTSRGRLLSNEVFQRFLLTGDVVH